MRLDRIQIHYMYRGEDQGLVLGIEEQVREVETRKYDKLKNDFFRQAFNILLFF